MTKHEEALKKIKRFKRTLKLYFKKVLKTWIGRFLSEHILEYIYRNVYDIQILMINSEMEHNSEYRELLQAKMKQTKDIQVLSELVKSMNTFIHSYKISSANYEIWKKYMNEVNEITGRYKQEEGK